MKMTERITAAATGWNASGRITLVYVIVATGWILFSDRLLVALVHDPDLMGWISLIKGWFFVAVTAWLLHVLVARAFDRNQKANERLRESEEKQHQIIEEALRARQTEMEQFTYAVSHDLRSPLVTIKTYLGYLEQDMAASEAGRVQEDLLYMKGAADKMDQLLDEILQLSRVGRMVNPPVRAAYQDLAQEAIDLMAGSIRQRSVGISVASRPVMLFCDKPRVVEVWQNLIENSIKFMGDEKRPHIEIGAEDRAGEVVFFVRDNGMGIDSRDHEKVFNVFEKLDSEGDGMGIGLALVRKIVGLYRGRAWIESAGRGQGTTVCFTLPDAAEHEEERNRR